MKNGSRIGFITAALVSAGWIAFSPVSKGDMEIQKEAKAAGVTDVKCQTCHTAAMPKKDSHELNDTGKWLVAEKEKRGAKKIDGAWLKDKK